jgi:Tfp pilus assembly protein PilN
MNAVNLIPLERRRSETPTLPGVPFLGLVVVLLVALGATFVYVGASERVSTRQGELTHINAATAAWTADAARYAPAVSGLKHYAKGFAQLSTLLGQRADWSLLLGQLAGVMPAQAQLTALTASAGQASSGGASASTGAPASASGITLSGCAASQPVVANTMVALRRLSGVSAVSLSTASRQSAGSGGGASGCSFPIQFSLSLQFSPAVGLVQILDTAGAGGTASSATAQTSSTPAQTTSTPAQTTSTPGQAASTTDSTGVVAQ